MERNGQVRDGTADAGILRWAGRVLSADDLRRSLNGHREIVLVPDAVVTPLALEHLRTNGVALKRQEAAPPPAEAGASWGYAQDRPHAAVRSAVEALRREGLAFAEFKTSEGTEPCRWARAVAGCVANGECRAGAVFCADAGLVCCVANKVAGLRAAGVLTVAQAARAALSLGANLLVVEMPGRTFHELRQILRALATGAGKCPPGVACTLGELDGHAHR